MRMSSAGAAHHVRELACVRACSGTAWWNVLSGCGLYSHWRHLQSVHICVELDYLLHG